MKGPLDAALDAVTVSGQLFCRLAVSAPWGIGGGPDPFSTFHVMLEGGGWLWVRGVVAPVPLRAGQMVVLPAGAGHVIADADPPRRPVPHFRSVAHQIGPTGALRLGGGGPVSRILCGAFHLDARDAPPLFGLLPPAIVTPPDPGVLATARALAAERAAAGPAWERVLDRLLGALFIQALRAWLEATDEAARGGLAALSDPRICRALAAVHASPDALWSVDRLAGVAAMSRSAFGQRFTELLGLPPSRYVRTYRLQRAAHLLLQHDWPLARVAGRVGYTAEEAFCRSFKRHFGVTPGQWRTGETVNPSG